MKSKILLVSALAFAATLGVSAQTAQAETSTSTASSTIKADAKLKVKLGDNLEKNKEIRNIQKEKQKEVKDIKENAKDSLKDLKDARKNATSTGEFKGIRKAIQNKMKLDVFEARKNALVRELTVSFNALTSARTRINNFIVQREGTASTTLMTDAKAKLAIADDKLAKAKISLDTLAAFHYASTTATSTATTTAEVELEKPRKVGDEAIKAMKDARNALKDVLTAIKKALKPADKDDEDDNDDDN
ncbi:MAG: hypothetical protein V4697_03180 [Patescibacteria group bacterium]